MKIKNVKNVIKIHHVSTTAARFTAGVGLHLSVSQIQVK